MVNFKGRSGYIYLYSTNSLLSWLREHSTSVACILIALMPKVHIFHSFCSPNMSIYLKLCYLWYMRWLVFRCPIPRTPPMVCYVGMSFIYDLGGCYDALHSYGAVSLFGGLALGSINGFLWFSSLIAFLMLGW